MKQLTITITHRSTRPTRSQLLPNQSSSSTAAGALPTLPSLHFLIPPFPAAPRPTFPSLHWKKYPPDLLLLKKGHKNLTIQSRVLESRLSCLWGCPFSVPVLGQLSAWLRFGGWIGMSGAGREAFDGRRGIRVVLGWYSSSGRVAIGEREGGSWAFRGRGSELGSAGSHWSCVEYWNVLMCGWLE